MQQPAAIFVHSLFRTASTYLFSRFRALGPRFTCYQEPFNEALVALNDPARHERLLLGAQGSRLLRHPRLDRPYFHEFWERRAQLAGRYRASFAYEEYFPPSRDRLPAAQYRWLAELLSQAQGTPVLQFCRSSGRADAIRHEFGGVHIHLWREPRTQWWSYKVSPYFDGVTRRIYERAQLPDALQRIGVHAAAGAASACLPPGDNYRLFYGLWLDAWLRLRARSDLSISVDEIALSDRHNRDASRRLSELVGTPMDLSDVRASGMAFTAEEDEFYAEVEHAVEEQFVASGRATTQILQVARDASASVRAAHLLMEHDAGSERNVRLAALAMMQQLAGPQGPRWRWRSMWPALQARVRRGWRALAAGSSPARRPVAARRLSLRRGSPANRGRSTAADV